MAENVTCGLPDASNSLMFTSPGFSIWNSNIAVCTTGFGKTRTSEPVSAGTLSTFSIKMRSQKILLQSPAVEAYKHTRYQPVSLKLYVGLIPSIITGTGGGAEDSLNLIIAHFCLLIGTLLTAEKLTLPGSITSRLY